MRVTSDAIALRQGACWRQVVIPQTLSQRSRAVWNWLNNSAPAGCKPFELICVPRIRLTTGSGDKTVRELTHILEIARQVGPKVPLTAIQQVLDAII